MRDVTRGSLLDRLALAAELVATGPDRPGVSTRGAGTGQVLAGHRPYRPGDDLRRLDPLATARGDRPIVRTTHREREERVHLVLDHSASMGLGGPARWDRARELVLLLAALGLAGLGRVTVSLAGAHGRTPWPAARGRASLGALRHALAGLVPQGPSSPAAVADVLGGPRGLRVLVTDFLDDAPADAWAEALAGPSPVWVLVLRTAQDPLPTVRGDAEVLDPETGGRHTFRLDDAAARGARTRLRSHDRARTARLREIGAATHFLDPAWTWERLALGPLRSSGLLTGA